MAKTVDLKLVLKHLSNGTLGENLCIICLTPLNDKYENIFTKICKEGDEFCVASVLENQCEMKFSEEHNYNVCTDCFTAAFMAHKFHVLASRSNKIINFYVEELSHNLDFIYLPEEVTSNTICISLPILDVSTPCIDFNTQAIGKRKVKEVVVPKVKTERAAKRVKTEEDDNIVVVIQENGEPLFYKLQADGSLVLLDDNEKKNYKKTLSKSVGLPKSEGVKRRKRTPMTHKLCSRCPVKYRFVAKLKEHMKQAHNVDLFICKECKATTEDEHEYHNHMRTHTNIHQCAICNVVFKKRDTIINHLKWHEKMKNISQKEGAHICEICGVITEDERALREHYDNKHYKKYTCYYCGRLYKGESSFETHIKKHEAHLQNATHKSHIEPQHRSDKSATVHKDSAGKQKCMCPTCGRYFVDERALMWHQRLHSNERPYKCEMCGRGFISVNRRNQHALCAHTAPTRRCPLCPAWMCGRGFISVNRRNQHALCAHTAPTRRCPLCPALFHLRSMVNTHIRKVHLKSHKRRNRVSKHQNVFWRTEAVPIQDLSVDIQNDILELQAATKDHEVSSAMQLMEMDDL